MTKTTSKTLQTDFKGFDDFIEVFRSGTHVDSAGTKRIWTNSDLDQMVANFTANSSPIVIGHPKANHPAYGWADQVRRVGNVLQAKFKQIEPQFAKMVEEGRFKNRSIRIVNTANGLSLGHVGFLGAQPPAIEGLAAIEFNLGSADTQYFDFECDWRTPSILAQMMRNMREFIISKFGVDEADRVLPNYQIDDLAMNAEQLRQDDLAEDANDPAEANDPEDMNPNSFGFSKGETMPPPNNQPNQPNQPAAGKDAGQTTTVDFAQHQSVLSELNAERKKNRRIECQAIIDKHLQRGVKPALLEGAVDFMLSLSQEQNSFEFAQGAGDKQTQVKTSEFAYFKTLLEQLPANVKFGETDFSSGSEIDVTTHDFAVPVGAVLDPDQLAIHNKAVVYQQSHKVDYLTAVQVVSRGK